MAQGTDPKDELQRQMLGILSAVLSKVEIADVKVLVTEKDGDGGVVEHESTIRKVLQTNGFNGEQALDFIQAMLGPGGRWDFESEKTGQRAFVELSR